MHCESLLRLSIEEVNFTSVPKTDIALSVLKAKQLQWTTIVCKNCKNGETAHYDKTGGYGWPPAEWENISGEVGTVNWGVEPPNPHGTSHPGSSASRWLYSTSAQLSLWIHSVPLTKTRTSSHRWYLFLASSFFQPRGSILPEVGNVACQRLGWIDWLTIAAVQYEVHVFTGDRWAAETDANVFITLSGTDDISERLPLIQSNNKTKFARNQVM